MEKKVALITGASRGIGAGIAKVLAGDGYNLVLTCEKNEDRLNDLAAAINNHFGVEVLTHVGDIANEKFSETIIDSVDKLYGRLDVLVNNAGTWKGGIITDVSLATWNRLIAVNLTGTFLMCKAAVPLMLSRKSGAIVNISSMWGVSGASCETAYSATKGGINAFTQALAKELAPSSITVNAIAPGVIDTDMNSGYSKRELKALMDEIPMCRFGTPTDIGKAVLGVINTPYMTGQIIPVDGGFL